MPGKGVVLDKMAKVVFNHPKPDHSDAVWNFKRVNVFESVAKFRRISLN